MKNLALIGVGRWGENYLSSAKNIKNCKIKYLCNKRHLDKNIFKNNYIYVNSYKSLINFSDIDGIIIATPASTHHTISKFFIKNNINILVEKPIALNINQILDLNKTSIDSDAKILFGHLYKYNSGYKFVKNHIKKIGKINYAEFINYSDGPKRKDVDIIFDRMYHDIYLYLDIFKELPRYVLSNYDKTHKITKSKLYLRNNCNIILKSSSDYNKKIRKITFKGEKGKIILDDIKKNVSIDTLELKKIFSYSDDALENQIKEFVKLIKTVNKNNFLEAINTVKIAQYCLMSLVNNKKIYLNEK
jgi:predicted dehydrogenase